MYVCARFRFTSVIPYEEKNTEDGMYMVVQLANASIYCERGLLIYRVRES